MTAPTPADMGKCGPKCKCFYGPHIGTAYVCDNPCAGQGDCSFDCQNGCQCDNPCSSSWTIMHTGASDADFSPCEASCGWTPTFGNIINFSAPAPGTFSSANYSYANSACGGPPYDGQTAKSVFGIDYVWGVSGWSSGNTRLLGSSTDTLALMITICSGPSAGTVYGRILIAGAGSNPCSLGGQVLTVTDAIPDE